MSKYICNATKVKKFNFEIFYIQNNLSLNFFRDINFQTEILSQIIKHSKMNNKYVL